MPRYVRPAGMPPAVEAIIDVIGNRVRQALLRHLALHGTSTTADLQEACASRRATVNQHLRTLEDAGLVRADLPRGARFGHSPTWTLDRAVLARQLDQMRDYLTGH